MKKFILGIIIGVVLLANTVTGISPTKEKRAENDAESLLGFTFIIGSIFDPKEENGTITGNAIHVFYYKSGFLVDNGGIVRGLTPIQFKDGLLVHLWKPGPLGLIAYVYGFCKEFEILGE